MAQAAVKELSSLSGFTGPKIGGQVTAHYYADLPPTTCAISFDEPFVGNLSV
jgi:hypothetical protein